MITSYISSANCITNCYQTASLQTNDSFASICVTTCMPAERIEFPLQTEPQRPVEELSASNSVAEATCPPCTLGMSPMLKHMDRSFVGAGTDTWETSLKFDLESL